MSARNRHKSTPCEGWCAFAIMWDREGDTLILFRSTDFSVTNRNTGSQCVPSL